MNPDEQRDRLRFGVDYDVDDVRRVTRVAEAASECMQWRPNNTHAPTACLNCAGAWDAHTRSHLNRMSPVPKVPVSFPLLGSAAASIVTPATCGYWTPVVELDALAQEVWRCRNCKGLWVEHERSQNRHSLPPKAPVVILRQGPAEALPPGQPVPRNETEQKPIIISHAVPNLTVKVLTVQTNPVNGQDNHQPVMTGIGTVHMTEPGTGEEGDFWVAFAGDEAPMRDLYAECAKNWSGAGVLAVVAEASLLAWITTDDERLSAAVYKGPSVRVEGAKATLLEDQGVFVLKTYVPVPGGDAFATVVYDRTDPWHQHCQWPLGTVITDVPRSDLYIDGNWRDRSEMHSRSLG